MKIMNKQEIEDALGKKFETWPWPSNKISSIELGDGASIIECDGDIILRADINLNDYDIHELSIYFQNIFAQPVNKLSNVIEIIKSNK